MNYIRAWCNWYFITVLVYICCVLDGNYIHLLLHNWIAPIKEINQFAESCIAHVPDRTRPHKTWISSLRLVTLMCQCTLGHIETEETRECQGNASLFFLGLFTLSFILFIFNHALSGSNNDTKGELRVRGKGVECADYAVTKWDLAI